MLPAKLAVAVSVAAGLVAALHLLRITMDRRWRAAFAVALATFVASQLGFSIAVDRLGLARRSDMDPIIFGIRSEPSLVLVGSSFSARALDGRALAAQLKTDVGQLTYPGVYGLEQDAVIDRFLVNRKTERILIELGTEFAGYANSKGDPLYLSAGYILNADPVRGWWSYRILLDRLGVMPVVELAANAITRMQSILANLTNTGFIHQMGRGDDSPVDGYAPQIGRGDSGVSDEQLARGLSSTRDSPYPIEGALGFRLWQRERLLARGVREVLFYETPIADPDRRAEARRLCEALGKLCISISDEILRSLPPPMWRDMAHLNEHGATIFTQWFGEQLRAVQ